MDNFWLLKVFSSTSVLKIGMCNLGFRFKMQIVYGGLCWKAEATEQLGSG